MRFLSGLLILSGVICFSACNSSKKEETNTAIKQAKFTKTKFGKCDTTGNNGATVKIDLWEPAGADSASSKIRTFLSGKVIERINEQADSASIAATPGADKNVKAAYEVFAANYKKLKAEFPDAPGCWFIEVKGDTVMVSDKVVQYQLDHFAFTGGAHPNSFRSYYLFDVKTGEEKNIKTFVADSVALLKKVETAFRKLEKIADTTNLENAGYFLADHKFFLPANYAFTKEGVFFYYNPYEIAAYARGPVTFTIPYAQLEGIVKKELIF